MSFLKNNTLISSFIGQKAFKNTGIPFNQNIKLALYFKSIIVAWEKDHIFLPAILKEISLNVDYSNKLGSGISSNCYLANIKKETDSFQFFPSGISQLVLKIPTSKHINEAINEIKVEMGNLYGTEREAFKKRLEKNSLHLLPVDCNDSMNDVMKEANFYLSSFNPTLADKFLGLRAVVLTLTPISTLIKGFLCEYANEGTLNEYSAKRSVQIISKEFILAVKELMKSLWLLHEQNIIHGDICNENIFVHRLSNGSIKVLLGDFHFFTPAWRPKNPSNETSNPKAKDWFNFIVIGSTSVTSPLLLITRVFSLHGYRYEAELLLKLILEMEEHRKDFTEDNFNHCMQIMDFIANSLSKITVSNLVKKAQVSGLQGWLESIEGLIKYFFKIGV